MAETRSLLRNPLSFSGAVLATLGAVLFLIVFAVDLFGYHQHPYIGIIFFLILPAFFVLGLLLIPIGLAVERRRRAAGRGASSLRWPRIDLNNPRHRMLALTAAVLTMLNLVIVSAATYRSVEYMDSVQFCGLVCHQVMQPEFEAYQDGPHSRVKCVDCHIGSGAQSYARAKVSGLRQLAALLSDSYRRPIPSPARTLQPARETCEQCHWPEKFHGDKVKTIREFADDEQNTETVTSLQVHVGGGSEKLGIATGIHWHMNLANRIEYIAADDQRQVIPYVFMRDRIGRTKEYLADGADKAVVARGVRRVMDCMDCHNRPAHTFASSAERAVDEAIAIGEIASTLPYIKREIVAALKQDYANRELAAEAIGSRLRAFYGTNYSAQLSARRADLDQVIAAAQRIYARNVFPAMSVGWGTYPNNLGHVAFPGCFRCHDDSHKASDGSTIGQDCELCHAIK